MEKRLPVPMITQTPLSFECGIACVKMILDFDGIENSYDDIHRDLPIRPEFGLYIYELGSYFIKCGYHAEIMGLNTNLFRVDQIGINTEEVRHHVEKIDYTNPLMRGNALKPGIETLLQFIRDGGTVTVDIPQAEDITQEIDRNRPVLIANTGRFLYSEALGHFKHGHNEHFTVISGYTEKDFYLNDPAPKSSEGLVTKHKIKHILYGIHANSAPSIEGGSILKLRPASSL